jgi:hypothetical protein
MEQRHESDSPLEQAAERLEDALALIEGEFTALTQENNSLRHEVERLNAIINATDIGISKLINQAEKMLEEGL